tara:strand:+ start:262 stop:588 length:327 start_codon:yes stop_codon:yes gene_type:complete
MDYSDMAVVRRHKSWDSFCDIVSGRLVLLTTRGNRDHTQVNYNQSDVLLLGRESAGVPEEVHSAADLRVRIPIAEGARSLNIALAGAMVLGEALRQTDGFPGGGMEVA